MIKKQALINVREWMLLLDFVMIHDKYIDHFQSLKF